MHPSRDGIFAHAPSRIVYDNKDKGYAAIRGSTGLEDIHEGTAKFRILGDGKRALAKRGRHYRKRQS